MFNNSHPSVALRWVKRVSSSSEMRGEIAQYRHVHTLQMTRSKVTDKRYDVLSPLSALFTIFTQQSHPVNLYSKTTMEKNGEGFTLKSRQLKFEFTLLLQRIGK